MDGRRLEIRLLTAGDGDALAHLAGRDSADVPPGPLLGGSIDGRLVAACSLVTGESIADPFSPTVEVQALLGVRARQLRRDRLGSKLRRLLRRRSRAALPSSPPGAGGRLLRI